MTGSVARIALVARQLMRQNRVLLLLMLLWPCVLSAILLAAWHGSPAKEDVASILEQELFYGMILVGLAASVALGNERKARRTHQVLGRAVSRTEYLLALGGSAFVPFGGYLLIWLGNAAMFAWFLHAALPVLWRTLLAGLAAGALLCTVGLVLSVVLPPLGAAAGTGLVLAGLAAAGRSGLGGGVAGLFAVVMGFVAPASMPWAGVSEAMGGSVLLVLVAALLFARRDLA